MATDYRIEPAWMGEFVEHLGIGSYHKYGGKGKDKTWEKMKRDEKEALRTMVSLVAESISIGLILAKKQPELVDNQLRYLNSMKPGYLDELQEDIRVSYQEFVYFKKFVDK